MLAGVLPRRLWPALEPHLPIRSAAAVSGGLTLVAGVAVGTRGFFAFATELADANNTWLLAHLAGPPSTYDASAGLVPYGVSLFTFFLFVFFTPAGLLALYLTASGTLRGVGAWFDDPHGDFVLTWLDWTMRTISDRNRRERRQLARERLEGADAPDVLRTGEWAGLPDADFVILAARRKAEWTAGAIILTTSEWYRLGVPFDLQTPVGLRTVYPLKKLDAVEVVRRGIQYELPRLRTRGQPPVARP